VRLELPAAHSATALARGVLRKFAAGEGVAAADLDVLDLVVSELFSNAVDHGGGRAAMEESDLSDDVRVGLHLHAADGSWTLSVTDQGGGDPAEVEPFLDPKTPPDLSDERGRGFFLLASMVDALSVGRSGDGLGLEFVARKRASEEP
jgi:anti-sigma regulatory factor (Ser/Thr protein kinase)